MAADPGAGPVGLASNPVPRLGQPAWKRLFDLAAAGAALVALAPVAALVAAGIRLFLGPGVLFRQARGGYGGEPFEILKFRTMTEQRDQSGQLLPDADRRHWFGDLLRRTSLDELPTLWNIVRGDMSIVGPRPLFAKYLPRYTDEQARRHCVRPGLTGLAQVSGRNSLSWEAKFELDLEYVRTRSWRTDVDILRRTVSTVFSTSGADGIDFTTEFMGTAIEPRTS